MYVPGEQWIIGKGGAMDERKATILSRWVREPAPATSDHHASSSLLLRFQSAETDHERPDDNERRSESELLR